MENVEVLGNENEIFLEEPVTWGKDTITKLTFIKPRGKHLRGIDFPPKRIDEIIKIASRLTLQPEGVFDAMSTKDLLKVTETVGNLL